MENHVDYVLSISRMLVYCACMYYKCVLTGNTARHPLLSNPLYFFFLYLYASEYACVIVCVRMYACVITVADSLGVLRGRFSSSKPFQNECFSVMKTYNLGKYNPIQSNPQILNLKQNLFMSTILVDSYFNRLGNCAHLRMHPYLLTYLQSILFVGLHDFGGAVPCVLFNFPILIYCALFPVRWRIRFRAKLVAVVIRSSTRKMQYVAPNYLAVTRV